MRDHREARASTGRATAAKVGGGWNGPAGLVWRGGGAGGCSDLEQCGHRALTVPPVCVYLPRSVLMHAAPDCLGWFSGGNS